MCVCVCVLKSLCCFADVPEINKNIFITLSLQKSFISSKY